jgi:response regulator of citrate/malate metabolism
MPQEALNQILNQLETLEVEELQRLQQTIQQYLADHRNLTTQTAFHQALIDSGLVKQIKHHSFDSINERKLIQIEGKPISETIIEERR